MCVCVCLLLSVPPSRQFLQLQSGCGLEEGNRLKGEACLALSVLEERRANPACRRPCQARRARNCPSLPSAKLSKLLQQQKSRACPSGWLWFPLGKPVQSCGKPLQAPPPPSFSPVSREAEPGMVTVWADGLGKVWGGRAKPPSGSTQEGAAPSSRAVFAAPERNCSGGRTAL